MSSRSACVPAALILLLACLVSSAVRAGEAVNGPEIWRGAWCSLTKDREALYAGAKELGFNAIIAGGNAATAKTFSEQAKAHGLESYWWFSITGGGKAMEAFRQVMGADDEKRLAEITADKDAKKSGYQFGGEPLPGHHDVLLSPILCFHRPEVVAWARQQVKAMLDACPDLTGVAFDNFGYQNLRCCLCPHSRKLFGEFRRAHPDMAEDAALVQFSRDTLVAFNNGLAAYIREVRPGAKVATHVYPVFLPEPLYANRLDVDYCCQTCAWFFEPYWPVEKVTRCARFVTAEENRFLPRPHGIPFIGVYVGRPYADKSAPRLAEELAAIRAAAPAAGLSIYRFNDVLNTPALRAAVKEDWEKRGGHKPRD